MCEISPHTMIKKENHVDQNTILFSDSLDTKFVPAYGVVLPYKNMQIR